MRVALLGYGAINKRVHQLLGESCPTADVVAIVVRCPHNVSNPLPHGIEIVTEKSQLDALKLDIVLEAASREAVEAWGEAALRVADQLVISSASALTNDAVLERLREAARQAGSQLVLSSGALAGIDALAAASLLPLSSVEHRIIKPPQSWSATLPGEAVDGSNYRILFRGTAREAARRYPLNANVAAISALASAGLDDTTVELVSDPSVSRNCHEVRAAGDFGDLAIRVENRALHGNPRSSELAALALVRAVRNRSSELVL